MSIWAFLIISRNITHVYLDSVQQMVSGESAGECLQTGFERHGLPPQRAPLDTVCPVRDHLNRCQQMVSGGYCEGLFPDTVCWTRLRNTWITYSLADLPPIRINLGKIWNFCALSMANYISWKRGRIRFRGVRFQTPNSVSFLGLTEFWGANSVSSSQPIICVPKRTHRVFRRTHRVCRKTQWGSVSSLLRNSTLKTVFRPFPNIWLWRPFMEGFFGVHSPDCLSPLVVGMWLSWWHLLCTKELQRFDFQPTTNH